MLKSDLFAIDKFLEEKLNSVEKKYRKDIANSIESKIDYILEKNNIFEGFKISRSYTDSLNIYLKNTSSDEKIYINIKYSKNSSFLKLIIYTPFFYYFDDKYPIKFTKKLINTISSKYQIKEVNDFGEYEAILYVDNIEINNNLEESIEKSLKIIFYDFEKYKKELNNLMSLFNEDEIFYFNSDCKFFISPNEFFNISFQINSIELENSKINDELFKLFDSSTNASKQRYELIIAHINLPLAKRFLAIDREHLTHDENVFFNQQIMKGFLTSINKYDPKIAQFSTYSYTWLLQAYTRVTEKIIRNRMKEKYGVTPTFHQLFKYKNEYKKNNNEFANFQILLNYAEVASQKILNDKKKKEKIELKESISKSSSFKLCKLITDNEIYSQKKLKDFAQHIYDLSEVCLNGKQKSILQRRYLPNLNNFLVSTTQLQILGDEFGLTRERIRQIEKSALRTIRIAYKKYPISKKINKSWLKPIVEKENKKGTSKALACLGKNNIFFMGQIKNLSLAEFKELYNNFEINDNLVEKLYYDLIPLKKLKTSFSDLKIEALRLSNRSQNALKNNNIHYVSQINLNELEYIPNLGEKSISEIRTKVLNFDNLT